MQERETEVVTKMRSLSSAAFQVDDFLSPAEISSLLEMFLQDTHKEHKPTGPVCSYYQGLESLDSRLEKLIGPHKRLSMSNIFATSIPHGLHTDAPKELSRTPYKAILLPLMYRADHVPQAFDLSFFTFIQRWYGFPAKFFKGEANVYSPHNEPVYDYEKLDNLGVGPAVTAEIRERWLTHLKPKWLEGLSIERQFDWKVGSAIIFDSFQVHCSSDFRRAGITSKIGLSLFTEKL